jgi:hypothetical protein
LFGADLNFDTASVSSFPILIFWRFLMNLGKTLFAQWMEFVPWISFARIIERYSGDVHVSVSPSTEHFCIMAYAQWT